MLYVPTMLLLLSSCAHPSPSPLLRVLGKKALLDFPGECWHRPAQPRIQSCLSNHYQSRPGSGLSIFLFVRLFSSLFFALPKLTARLIQSGQRDVSGEALPFKGAIQGRRKQKKRLSSKSLELFASNNTALTEQPKIRWAECVRAAATPPERSEGTEQRCPRGCLSFPEPQVMPKA